MIRTAVPFVPFVPAEVRNRNLRNLCNLRIYLRFSSCSPCLGGEISVSVVEAGTDAVPGFQRYIDIDRIVVDKNRIDINQETESRWDGSLFML